MIYYSSDTKKLTGSKQKFRTSWSLFFALLLSATLSSSLFAKSLTSVLRENFKVRLSSTQPGPILLEVQEGDVVVKDAPLFRVTPKELEMKVRLAEMGWKQAKVRLEKIKNPRTETEMKRAALMFKQNEDQYLSGGISQDAYEVAKVDFQLATEKGKALDIKVATLDVEMKLAQLESAKYTQEKATVLAPFDGRVNHLLIQPNEMVGAGQEVLELINITPVYAILNFPLSGIAGLSSGTPIRISISTGTSNEDAKGVIKYISDEVDAVSQTVPVRIEIQNAKRRFKPGMRVRMSLPLSTNKG